MLFTHTKTRKILITGFVMLALGLAATAAEAQTKKRTRLAQASPGTIGSLPPVETGVPAQHQLEETEIRRGELAIDSWIDVQLRIANKEDVDIGDRGFSLNDAAIYIAKDYGAAKAFIDLPFSSTLSGGAPGSFFNANQAQAFVQMNYGQLGVRMGQYDSFFSVEHNDSKYRFFADQGAIDANLLPDTHLGLQGIYTVNQFMFQAQVTNPSGASTMQGENPEFAVHGRYEDAGFHAGFGFGLHETKANITNNKTNMIVDITGGKQFNKFRLDGEFVIRKSAGSDKTANGFGVFGNYQVDAFLGLGGRFEYLKDAPVGGGIADNVMRFALGPSYRLAPDLFVRGDFTLDSTKPAGGTETTIFGLAASFVADF